eukprot:scaffold2.g7483.t1
MGPRPRGRWPSLPHLTVPPPLAFTLTLCSPTIYFHIRRRQLTTHCQRGSSARCWRSQGAAPASAPASALRRRRCLGQLSILLPAAMTNVDPQQDSVEFVGPTGYRCTPSPSPSPISEPFTATPAAPPPSPAETPAGVAVGGAPRRRRPLAAAYADRLVKRSRSEGDVPCLLRAAAWRDAWVAGCTPAQFAAAQPSPLDAPVADALSDAVWHGMGVVPQPEPPCSMADTSSSSGSEYGSYACAAVKSTADSCAGAGSDSTSGALPAATPTGSCCCADSASASGALGIAASAAAPVPAPTPASKLRRSHWALALSLMIRQGARRAC